MIFFNVFINHFMRKALYDTVAEISAIHIDLATKLGFKIINNSYINQGIIKCIGVANVPCKIRNQIENINKY